MQDTIWVGQTPIGDFIMGALNEDIDLDELQNAPYRCKQTKEMFAQPAVDLGKILDDYEAETKELPLGYEDRHIGASCYNHRMTVIRELRKRIEAAGVKHE